MSLMSATKLRNGKPLLLQSDEDMDTYLRSATTGLRAARLGSFATHADAQGNEAEQRAAVGQKNAAMKSLRRARVSEDILASEAGPAMVLDEISDLDYEAQQIIKEGLSSAQLKYLLKYDDASQQLVAIQDYFGGVSLQRQNILRAEMANVRYMVGKKGSGMIDLFTKMEGLREAYKKAGGKDMKDQQLMSDILAKLKRVKGGRFRVEAKAFLKLVNKMAITLTELRKDLVVEDQELEQDEEILSDASDDERPAGDTLEAMVTKAVSNAINKRRVDASNELSADDALEAMVTKAVSKALNGKGKKTSECYGWRDKGECRFGDRCRFSHSGGN
jgi:hypothetical protein